MNELVTVPHVFQFDVAPIRVFDIGACRAAVASDICAALDIKDTTKAVAKLDEDDKWTLHRSDTPACIRGIWEQFAPQVQVVILVSEDGATDLILESRKPQARAFRRWLTHVVWPAIRDTGTYAVAPALEGEELLAKAVLEAGRIIEARNARIAELEPKGEFFDDLMSADGTYSWQAAADVLGVGRTTLTSRLRAMEIIQANKLPYARYLHHFKVLPRTRVHPHDGTTIPYVVTEVRPSGMPWLRRRLQQDGLI